MADAPVVDSTNQTVFAFSGNDGAGLTPSAAVYQAPLTLASRVRATIGRAFANSVYSGAFDDNYFNAADPSLGFLYACGNRRTISGTDSLQRVSIYRIGFNSAGTMTNVHDANRLDISNAVDVTTGGTPTTCSPGTEIFNSNIGGGTDLLFFSVQDNGHAAGCGGGGCVMSFNVTARAWPRNGARRDIA